MFHFLLMFGSFVLKEERLLICKEIIKESLAEIHAKCMKKRVRFDLESLVSNVFPIK